MQIQEISRFTQNQTQTNYSGQSQHACKQRNNQSELKEKTRKCCQARENMVVVLFLIGWESSAIFFKTNYRAQ